MWMWIRIREMPDERYQMPDGKQREIISFLLLNGKIGKRFTAMSYR